MANRTSAAARRLAQAPPSSSLPRPRLNCIACNWRRASNIALKAVVDAGNADADYSGFMYGIHDGGFVVSQYYDGKQVSCVTVALELVPEWLDSMANYIENRMSALTPEGVVEEDQEEEPDVEQEAEEEPEEGAGA